MTNSPMDDNANPMDAQLEIEVPVIDQAPILPRGSFPATVLQVKSSISNAGNPTLIWEFAVVTAQYNTKISMWTAQTPAAMWKLTNALTALGFQMADGKIRFKPADAVGRRCIIEVIEETYDGKVQAKVKNVLANPGGFEPLTPVNADSPV